MKVLVIDDESALTDLLVLWLNRQGHKAFGITAGADALSSVTSQTYDVVLLDLTLRDANGMGLIAPIRVASPKTSVIVMTGMDDPILSTLARQQGASDFIPKPIDFKVLSRALSGCRESA